MTYVLSIAGKISISISQRAVLLAVSSYVDYLQIISLPSFFKRMLWPSIAFLIDMATKLQFWRILEGLCAKAFLSTCASLASSGTFIKWGHAERRWYFWRKPLKRLPKPWNWNHHHHALGLGCHEVNRSCPPCTSDMKHLPQSNRTSDGPLEVVGKRKFSP